MALASYYCWCILPQGIAPVTAACDGRTAACDGRPLPVTAAI
jgi:hypothetical protein